MTPGPTTASVGHASPGDVAAQSLLNHRLITAESPVDHHPVTGQSPGVLTAPSPVNHHPTPARTRPIHHRERSLPWHT